MGASSDPRTLRSKKPLDKQAACEYNINVKRLCRKRCPQLKLKNNRIIWTVGRLFFIILIFAFFFLLGMNVGSSYVASCCNKNKKNHC